MDKGRKKKLIAINRGAYKQKLKQGRRV